MQNHPISINPTMPTEKQIKYWESMKGRNLSKETKQKISLGNKGKIYSEETKNKISLAHEGKPKPWLKGKHLIHSGSFKKGHETRDLNGNLNPAWKGGKYSNKGYIRIWNPEHPFADRDGYVLEHRIIVEKKIGRYLTSLEVVHHLNFDKADNRIENLMLFSSQKEHQRFHHKLQQYGYTTRPIQKIINERWN